MTETPPTPAPPKDHGRAGRDLKAAVGSAVVLLAAIAASAGGTNHGGGHAPIGASALLAAVSPTLRALLGGVRCDNGGR